MTPPVAQTLRIGTRGSRLALQQAGMVAERLSSRWPVLTIERVIVKTVGDRILDTPLAKIGDKGLFTKELETALLDGKIDLAVHSLKDLPTRIPQGLALGAILEREDPRDALVSPSGRGLSQLPAGARVGTSSLRRRSQILAFRPDLRVEDLRGNVPTRIERAEKGEVDAVVLARAGLCRLGLESKITEVIDPDTILPAPGQGAIAVEIRAGDPRVAGIVAPLDDLKTRLATTAERALLAGLEGGCQVPIGALGTIQGTRLRLQGLVADLEGKTIVRATEEGEVMLAVPRGRPSAHDGPAATRKGVAEPDSTALAAALGERLAARLLERGARSILEHLFADGRPVAVPAPGAEGEGE